MGDKADLSGNDFLRFWEHDPGTDVVLLYLESLGNPRRFGQITRRLTATKPVIAVKSGRTAAGKRAASSHTGALLEASEATVDALFDHAGVIRVDTLDEQLDVAALLVGQPLPRGDRIAIVTNAGGPGIACADTCAAAGLRIEPLGDATREALRELLARGRRHRQPRRHARRRHGGGLPPRDRGGRGRPGRRRRGGDLHPAPARPARGSRSARGPCRGAARESLGDAGAERRHGAGGTDCGVRRPRL